MTPESEAPQSEQVAAFFQKHRTGLVTLVFTDLVDSVALLSRLGDQAGATFMQRRRQIVRETLQGLPEGEEIETAGDSFLLAFAKPSDGVRFALQSQARLRRFSAESNVAVQERIGIHLGEVVIAENETVGKAKDFYGIQLATCFRVMSLAAGGQILLTRGAFDSARQVLKGEDIPGVGPLSWASHGPYLLKGIEEAVEVCEVGELGQSPLSAPKTSEKAQRQVRPDEEPVLGWRPAVGQEVPNTKWVLEEKLGEGGFGEVWVGRHEKWKERHVFKFCFRADRVRSLKREVTLFRLLQERVGEHPNIVRLHGVYLEEAPFYLEEEYVAGKDLKSWCEAQGGVEKVSMKTRLEIVAQAAEALQAAHDAGIIHRDVKPGNVLVGTPGPGTRGATDERGRSYLPVQVKLTDFGIGQVISAEYLAGVTKAGFTQTMLGSTSTGTGTTMYLAPEIVAGIPATTRSDIYSLGVVLYQLIVGDLARPLTTDWTKHIADLLLRDDLARCFAGQPEERFESAGQLAEDLRSLPQRQAAQREQETVLAARAMASRRWRVVRLAGVGTVILTLGLTVASILNRNTQVRQAREQTLPEIARLAAAQNYAAAFSLAQQIDKYIPNDPVLTRLWSQIAVALSVVTTPAGAEVYFKEYQKPQANWQHLAKSPLNQLKFPRGYYRWQLKKDGYDILEQAATSDDGPVAFVMDLVGTIPPGMVRVTGGRFTPTIAGADRLEAVELEDFFIDKFEVSNRQFKEFVDRRGYETSNYWKLPFIKDGKPISRDEAFKGFRDSTGRPGPATWSNGSFSNGQDNYPVSGVSWYEAVAYAEFAGKSLPTLWHWDKAAGTHAVAQIVSSSNFGGKGPAPVGSYQGMSPSGAVDMAGNVGEWIWNEGEPDKRWIGGGAWSDPSYMFLTLDAATPLNRAPTRGFRCMKCLSGTGPPQATLGPAILAYRDYKTEKPVSDEVFQSLRGYYAYDKTGLDSKIESIDDRSPHWKREKITFNAAYGNEKVPGYLFLPKKGSPPYQTIIYFPGAGATMEGSSETHMSDLANKAQWGELEVLELILQSGRAFFYPIYKGTYERGIGLTSTRQNTTSAHRDCMIQITKDFQRSLDYLGTRKDIDRDRLGYVGLSWGARLGTLLLALDGRVKSGVLIIGGLPMEKAAPEVDQINFVTRVKVPILMLNGKYDPLFPVAASQIPLFQLLSTPEKDKRHLTYEQGHYPPPRSELEKEMSTWFDRYLGSVK